MSDEQPMRVVLCWHMHQPQYRDPVTGTYHLPWTYLHAIKDYIDMAALLEAEPNARAVINFAPTLLEQIDDYAMRLRDHLSDGRALGDSLLAGLAANGLTSDSVQRLTLMRACLRSNEPRFINRYPVYRELADIAKWNMARASSAVYLSDQYLHDLLMWYHLAWLGETVRRTDPRVKKLMDKARFYVNEDRVVMLTIISELMDSVIPRYRALAERGQIEISLSPYAHPIVPLLLDFGSARDAMPEVTLPSAQHYPGGEPRAHWHMEEGLRVFEQHFGFRPKGCWPSEGSVSEKSIAIFGKHGIEWVASGENVLRNSLAASPILQKVLNGGCVHRPYHVKGSKVNCFFRDDGLSDLIGFTYSTWHADDAVNNLIHNLENIAKSCPDRTNAVVSIIMDGENAWEHYPENGYYFLSALYKKLSSHTDLRMTTFGDVIAEKCEPLALDKMVAGSWVYGSFSTWIGDKDKNRGWDMLCTAKKDFDRVVKQRHLKGEALARVERQLAVCEGSDWFWWFGDYNPSDSVADFDHLFRRHLATLYDMLGEPLPPDLDRVISRGGGAPAGGGVMRSGKAPGT